MLMKCRVRHGKKSSRGLAVGAVAVGAVAVGAVALGAVALGGARHLN